MLPKALLALGEANSQGAWTRLCTQLLPEDEPLVVGIDFPTVALSEACWVNGELRMRLVPQNESFAGLETKFRITGLEEPAVWTLADDMKQATIDLIKKELGKVDMVIYSLAAPAGNYRMGHRFAAH